MIAFDSNILIYACNKSDRRRQAIALDLLETSADGILLWQAACEFVAASRKLAVHGFTSEDAWGYLSELLASLPLVLPNRNVMDRARVLHVEQQWSFWDAMIVASCLESGVTRLYSEDLPGRAPPGLLEIVNPFA